LPMIGLYTYIYNNTFNIHNNYWSIMHQNWSVWMKYVSLAQDGPKKWNYGPQHMITGLYLHQILTLYAPLWGLTKCQWLWDDLNLTLT
jgi:hypothetical protein